MLIYSAIASSGGRVPAVRHARGRGRGTPVFSEGIRAGLDMADERRFASGVVYPRYLAQ